MTEGPGGMAFIVLASRGGHYDDEAFMGGYRLGVLDATLGLSRRHPSEVPTLSVFIRHTDEAQADLIAMRHCYLMTQSCTCENDNASHYNFTRGTIL